MSKPGTRVLVVRLGAIGDVVMALPLAGALKREHPGIFISWLVEEAAAPLVAACPLVDETLLFPKGAWLKNLKQKKLLFLFKEAGRFFQDLSQKRFDLLLDLQGLLKSRLLSFSVRHGLRLGFSSKEGGDFLFHGLLPRQGPKGLMGKEYRAFVHKLGAEIEPWALSLAIPEEARQKSLGLLQEEGVEGPYILFCPATTRPQKYWPSRHWGRLAESLGHAGYACVAVGGPGDILLGKEISQASHGALTSFCGRTSLLESAALMEGAAAVIGVDTGMTHLSMSLKKPTVALFGSTRPYTSPPHPQAMILYHELSCAPCRRRPSCKGKYTCLEELLPQEVLAATEKVLL